MTQLVYNYQDAMALDYKQASIYLDACFLLAYYDLKDRRGDVVARLMEKWSLDGIEKVGVSSHVFGEVVQELFRRQIEVVLELIYEKVIEKRPLTSALEDKMGDEGLAKYLLQLAGADRVRRMIRGEGRIYVPGLIKQVKSSDRYRPMLDHHYNLTLDDYTTLLNRLSEMGLPIETPTTGFETCTLASAFMRFFQLDSYDALHYAVATEHGYPFFATLDSDFVHTRGQAPSGATKILKIA